MLPPDMKVEVPTIQGLATFLFHDGFQHTWAGGCSIGESLSGDRIRGSDTWATRTARVRTRSAGNTGNTGLGFAWRGAVGLANTWDRGVGSRWTRRSRFRPKRR